MTITFAVTTLAAAEANVPACEFCDADVAGTEIGDGMYLCEIRHEPGCPGVLPRYDKP